MATIEVKRYSNGMLTEHNQFTVNCDELRKYQNDAISHAQMMDRIGCSVDVIKKGSTLKTLKINDYRIGVTTIYNYS